MGRPDSALRAEMRKRASGGRLRNPRKFRENATK